MSKTSFISLSGIEYMGKDTWIESFDTSIGRNPIQFAFSVSPDYPTTLSDTFIVYDIIKFDIGDYFSVSYKISIWNPNSDPTGDVANAVVVVGSSKFDTMGQFTPADSNNMSTLDYLFGGMINTEDGIVTDISGLGTSGNAYAMTTPLQPSIVPFSDGSEITLRMSTKTGYKAKGFITLV